MHEVLEWLYYILAMIVVVASLDLATRFVRAYEKHGAKKHSCRSRRRSSKGTATAGEEIPQKSRVIRAVPEIDPAKFKQQLQRPPKSAGFGSVDDTSDNRAGEDCNVPDTLENRDASGGEKNKAVGD